MLEWQVPPEVILQICRQAANKYTTRRHGYHATEQQIAFFVLSWLQNQPANNPTPDKTHPTEQAVADHETLISNHTEHVAHHLNGDSGELVTHLKREDQMEWEAFFFALESMLRKLSRHYPYSTHIQLQEDVHVKVAMKLLDMVRQMVDGVTLDRCSDILQFVGEQREDPQKGYNFSSTFQNYAYIALRNAMFKALRKPPLTYLFIASEDEPGGEGVNEEKIVQPDGPTADPAQRLISEEEEIAQQQKLTVDLAQLLAVIECLPRKRRLVAAYTLAARPQFWLAVDLTKSALPDWYPQKSLYFYDAEIAKALDMNENSIRANRWYVYKDLQAKAPELTRLFEVLSAAHF
ncbi:MAG: hypothetical protein U0350_51070 [Caldilineaceae bacterium]